MADQHPEMMKIVFQGTANLTIDGVQSDDPMEPRRGSRRSFRRRSALRVGGTAGGHDHAIGAGQLAMKLRAGGIVSPHDAHKAYVRWVGPMPTRMRSEERRVGNEGVSPCRSRGSPD